MAEDSPAALCRRLDLQLDGDRRTVQRPRGRSIDHSPPSTRARGRRKSKAVAGRQGRALRDRPADPVCEKCPHTLRRSDRGHRGEHQGVGLDDASAGGRGWYPVSQRLRDPRLGPRRLGEGRRGGRRGAHGPEAQCPGPLRARHLAAGRPPVERSLAPSPPRRPGGLFITRRAWPATRPCSPSC